MQTLTPPEQLVCEITTVLDNNPDIAQKMNARLVARFKRAAYALRNNLEVPQEN